MRVRSTIGAARRKILCSFYARTAPLGDRGPIVSFTFDDFPRTAFSIGGTVLQAFGARGTYYVAPSLMNVSNELGDLFHVEDVAALLKSGHELGSQTMNHVSGRSMSRHAFRDDVQQGRTTVEGMAGADCPNFCYPYGHATLGTKSILGSVVTTSRSVIPGLNGPDVDLNLLRANRLYGGIDQAPAVQQLIARNVRRKTWLVFYTHDIRPTPSEYGCTPELFEFAVSAAAKSGSRILTVNAVIEELGLASPGNGHQSQPVEENVPEPQVLGTV
jgi:peptidoglycan/xylan/chitin deacetylase (PgdA/CDA1 family)